MIMTSNIKYIGTESDEFQSHGDNIQVRRNDIQTQEDEIQSHAPEQNEGEFENICSEDEFDDFTDDNSVTDKNYYTSSSPSDDD